MRHKAKIACEAHRHSREWHRAVNELLDEGRYEDAIEAVHVSQSLRRRWQELSFRN